MHCHHWYFSLYLRVESTISQQHRLNCPSINCSRHQYVPPPPLAYFTDLSLAIFSLIIQNKPSRASHGKNHLLSTHHYLKIDRRDPGVFGTVRRTTIIMAHPSPSPFCASFIAQSFTYNTITGHCCHSIRRVEETRQISLWDLSEKEKKAAGEKTKIGHSLRSWPTHVSMEMILREPFRRLSSNVP